MFAPLGGGKYASGRLLGETEGTTHRVVIFTEASARSMGKEVAVPLADVRIEGDAFDEQRVATSQGQLSELQALRAMFDGDEKLATAIEPGSTFAMFDADRNGPPRLTMQWPRLTMQWPRLTIQSRSVVHCPTHVSPTASRLPDRLTPPRPRCLTTARHTRPSLAGALDESEFFDAISTKIGLGIDRQHADAIFKQLDSDRNGEISFEEWAAFIKATKEHGATAVISSNADIQLLPK